MIGDIIENSLVLSDDQTVPIEFQVSGRAGKLRLTINKEGRVILVRPYGVSYQDTLPFLKNSIPWIKRTLIKVRSAPKQRNRMPFYPVSFHFPVTGETFPVRLEWQDVCWVGAREFNGEILVTGHVLNSSLVRKALQEYLRRKAEDVFAHELYALAKKHSFFYKKLSVRFQGGRWGSCSTSGTISLNGKMLFFPTEALHYVMIHELCHTREMNHSARFWNEVAKYCPEYNRIRAEIKKGFPDLWQA